MHRRKLRTLIVCNDCGTYTAQISRRAASKNKPPEDQRSGFISRHEAERWASEAVTRFIAKREKRNTARRKNRAVRRSNEAWAESQLSVVLAQEVHQNGARKAAAKSCLRSRAEMLNLEVAFQACKNGEDFNAVYRVTKRQTGGTPQQIIENALAGVLDRIFSDLLKASTERAAAIARAASLLDPSKTRLPVEAEPLN